MKFFHCLTTRFFGTQRTSILFCMPVLLEGFPVKGLENWGRLNMTGLEKKRRDNSCPRWKGVCRLGQSGDSGHRDEGECRDEGMSEVSTLLNGRKESTRECIPTPKNIDIRTSTSQFWPYFLAPVITRSVSGEARKTQCKRPAAPNLFCFAAVI